MSQSQSSTFELGLALLHEGSHRFLRILGLGQLPGHGLLEAIAITETQLLDRVGRMLRHLDCDRTFRSDFPRQFERCWYQLVRSDARFDNSESIQLRAEHPHTGQHHAAQAGVTEETLGVATATQQANIDLGEPEAPFLGSDQHVAGRGKGEAAPQSGAVDRTDHGLLTLTYAVVRLSRGAAALPVIAGLASATATVLDIRSGAEDLAGTRQYGDADVVPITDGIEGCCYFLEYLAAVRIYRRVVDRYQRDERLDDIDTYDRRCHGPSPVSLIIAL